MNKRGTLKNPEWEVIMSALGDFEAAMKAVLLEQSGEEWPIAAYVVYVATLDPEQMHFEEPAIITPEGQHTAMTRGILEQALDAQRSATAPEFSFVDWDEDDDDDADA